MRQIAFQVGGVFFAVGGLVQQRISVVKNIPLADFLILRNVTGIVPAPNR